MTKREVFEFMPESDLTEAEIIETQETYFEHAQDYAQHIERVSDARIRIQTRTLFPFLNHYQEARVSSPILFVGAGSGRDLQTAEELGFEASAIDTSSQMIAVAREYGVTSPYQVMDMRHIDLPRNSFGGIFCETAISHIKKSEMPVVLRKFFELLVPGGILMLGIRIADGRIYVVNDVVGGKRYNTTMTESESRQMIEASGFEVLVAPKYEVQDRPKMVDYILRKPI